jgi:pimeloyl-ACP methyl ester carboxylesterase
MRDHEDMRLTTNGVTLHAVAAGPSDGPLVILLHGFPEFWYGWRHQIEPLAATGFRVLVPDQRGYNLSSKPEGLRGYTMDVLADDVLGLAAALGRSKFALVGHDWGAVLGWHLAALHPEKIDRAVILNGPHLAAMRDYTLSHPGQMLRSWYFGYFQVPWLPERVLSASDFAALRQSLTKTSLPGTFQPDDLERYREAWAQPGALTAILNWYRALPLHPRAFRAERITVPVRVIWGDRDPGLQTGVAEASLALCERGEMFHLADASHWVQHEKPAEVNRLIVEFLSH